MICYTKQMFNFLAHLMRRKFNNFDECNELDIYIYIHTFRNDYVIKRTHYHITYDEWILSQPNITEYDRNQTEWIIICCRAQIINIIQLQ